jgi:uncharacterized metal-binding protein YceD (DUF177 family)
MKIRLEDIPEDGLVVDLDSSQGWVEAAVSDALEGKIEHATAHLEIRRIGPGVHVDGRGSATALRTCDRCLAALRLRAAGDIDLYYDPFIDLPGGAGGLHADDLDVGFFRDEELDLADVLLEFFTLEAPARVVCGEAGIERLEEGECRLEAQSPEPDGPVDPRLAVLKRMKIDA